MGETARQLPRARGSRGGTPSDSRLEVTSLSTAVSQHQAARLVLCVVCFSPLLVHGHLFGCISRPSVLWHRSLQVPERCVRAWPCSTLGYIIKLLEARISRGSASELFSMLCLFIFMSLRDRRAVSARLSGSRLRDGIGKGTIHHLGPRVDIRGKRSRGCSCRS